MEGEGHTYSLCLRKETLWITAWYANWMPGGYTSMRHNPVRDSEGQIMRPVETFR